MSSRTRQLSYNPALDGVRALAIAATAAVHLAPGAVPGGFIGVDLFFVLSGFLIMSLLLGERDRTGRVDLRRFYVARTRRLMPALLALLVVYVAWSTIRHVTHPWTKDMVTAALSGTYVVNWAIAVGHSVPWEMDHVWSLSVEEQFYLVAPVTVVLLLRRLPAGRSLALAFAGLGLLSGLASGISWDLLHSGEISYEATPLHSLGLLAGCALATLFVSRAADRPLSRLASIPAVPITCLVGLLALALTITLPSGVAFWFAIPAASALSAVLVASLLLPPPVKVGTLRTLLGSRLMVALGRPPTRCTCGRTPSCGRSPGRCGGVSPKPCGSSPTSW